MFNGSDEHVNGEGPPDEPVYAALYVEPVVGNDATQGSWCDPDIIEQQPIEAQVRTMLVMYTRARHPHPNVWTKNGNLRDLFSSNGSLGRCDKFVARETDPARPVARREFTARAQEVMGRLSTRLGAHQLARLLLQELTTRAFENVRRSAHDAAHG